MVGDATRFGAVPVLLRRVVAARVVRRLLVLGGLLIAAWILGGAAQSAHAGEVPVQPSSVQPSAVIMGTPVLGDAVKTVHRPEPVRNVVETVAERPEDEAATEMPAPLPVAPDVRQAVREVGAPAAPVKKSPSVRPAAERERAPVAAEVGGPATPVMDDAPPSAVQDDPAPMPAPDGLDERPATGGSGFSGVMAFPNIVAWAPAPPRTSGAQVFGAVPPAVRTAADEPSFAPD
ncbi:hypothetical protein ACN3XK_60275 [Actinomadura welshii]